MKLSIIIPVYNAEKYIEECLESVLTCSISDMECILIDDGSIDKSPIICQKYVEKDLRIKLIRKENAGVSAARNTGLSQATGNTIMFLDADDYLDASIWEVINHYIGEYDFTAFSYFTLNPDKSTQKVHFPIKAEITQSLEEVHDLAFTDSCLNTCWCKLFQKRIISEHKIQFNETLPIGEDYQFVLEYLLQCKSVILTQDCVLYYRQHDNSAMKCYNWDKRMDYTQILYKFQTEYANRLGDSYLINKMNTYYFRVLTNLCRQFTYRTSISALKKIYSHLVTHDVFKQVMEKVEPSTLCQYKRVEYNMMKHKRIRCMAIYFKLKGKV